MKFLKNPFIRGTMYLTLAGFVSRIIGFFFRIFIAHSFGEEAMGIYQLTGPVMALSYSLCCAGLQTALSKFVAKYDSSHSPSTMYGLLVATGITSVCLSAMMSSVVFLNADTIACTVLLEERTAPLLRILALSFPLSAIHCCINGFYYGIKKTSIPSLMQLFEQVTRVSSVWILYTISSTYYHSAPLSLLMAGSVIAEGLASIFSIGFIFSDYRKNGLNTLTVNAGIFFPVLKMALPLSFTRIVVNLLQSVESVYIPEMLRSFGMTTKEALSIYGVLTGMALSLILFPTAITNSVAVLLLPMVSNADAEGNQQKIKQALSRSIACCTLLGGASTVFFLTFGNFLGDLLFHSKTAGHFICGLSFICPFLYLNTALSSILHGLGKAFATFWVNTSSLLIRIAFVIILIPKIGITGYLLGLLTSQLTSCLFYLFFLRNYLSIGEIRKIYKK